MEYTIAAYTGVGARKIINQDSFCIRRAILSEGEEIILAVVCDGMGGLSKGELASAETVRSFGTWFDTNMEQLSAMCGQNFEHVRWQWEMMIQELHNRLRTYAQTFQIVLGTTLVAWLSIAGRYLVVSIGDSRLYEYQGELRQITQDQSLVGRELELGRITETEALYHPQRNILLQCLGAGPQVIPVFFENKVSGGAIYLLCSDGFVHAVRKSELEQRLSPPYLTSKETMTRILSDIVNDCKARGEQDDITAVLIKCSETPLTVTKPSRFQRILRRINKQANQVSNQVSSARLVETAQIIYTQEHI